MGKACRKTIKQRQNGWQAEDRQRQSPGKFIRFQQKRVTKPPQASNKITKTEQPADPHR
ncbi:hypothetical protein D3C80_2116920 [compost metagenome]